MAFAPVFRPAFPGTFDRHQPVIAAAGWWVVAGKTTVAAYQAVGAASLTASYINLANPGTYNLTLAGSGLNWSTSLGWGSNWDADRYLKTGITPAVDQSWSLLVRWTDAPAGYNIAVGNDIDVNYKFGLGSGPSNAGWFLNGKGLLRSAAAVAAGVFAVTDEPYINGTDVGSLSGSITGSSGPVYIGGKYVNEFNAGNSWTGYILAVAIYGDTLTAGEVATVSAAMAAL